MALREMRRLVSTVVVMVILGVGARAAVLDDADRRPTEGDRDRALLDVAIGVGGSMGADLSLRLLEQGQLRTRALRREACDVARARMAEATEPLPLLVATGFGENREVERGAALKQYRVDALSLRCRLARQLLELDRREARETILELQPGLGIPESGCQDILIPSSSVFFATLGEVLEESLSTAERRQGLQWEIARRYVGALRTPVEIAPACKLVTSLGARAGELEMTVAELADAISRMPGSPRALLVMSDYERAGPAIAGLLEAVRRSEPTHKRLREALRGLVVRSLEGPRCADLSTSTTGILLEYFNDEVLAGHPIQAGELKLPSAGDYGKEHQLYSSAKSRRMLEELKDLYAAQRQLGPESDRSEWVRRFDVYLASVRSWNAVEERSDMDYVSEKTPTVTLLIEIAPDRGRRLEVVRDFAVMLRHATTAGSLEYVPLSLASYVVCRLEGAEREQVLEMFRTSGSSLLSAYATLQLEGVDVFDIGGTQTAP